MGTNYYVIPNRCDHCGRGDESIHLGKSSLGWKFSLQANGFEFYKDWPTMQEWLYDKYIQDEYGKRIEPNVFARLVESKQNEVDPEKLEGDIWIGGYKFHNYEFS